MYLCDLTVSIVSFSGPEMILVGSSMDFKEIHIHETTDYYQQSWTEMMQKQNSYFT